MSILIPTRLGKTRWPVKFNFVRCGIINYYYRIIGLQSDIQTCQTVIRANIGTLKTTSHFGFSYQYDNLYWLGGLIMGCCSQMEARYDVNAEGSLYLVRVHHTRFPHSQWIWILKLEYGARRLLPLSVLSSLQQEHHELSLVSSCTLWRILESQNSCSEILLLQDRQWRESNWIVWLCLNARDSWFRGNSLGYSSLIFEPPT